MLKSVFFSVFLFEKTETMGKIYSALVVEEFNDKYIQQIRQLNTDDLPHGDVLVKVHYSSLNYKDALSATGNKGVTKKYPHTPGIDAAGVVEWSESADFPVGDEVIVTGYDLGMHTPGGFGQYIRVPAEWVVKLPRGLSMKESMIIGTAGFTSGISVLHLVEKVDTEAGTVIVSGATGGVGSIAVAILSKLGYKVAAITGKSSEKDFLLNLGATEIIPRDSFSLEDQRPILSAKYAGGIDTVGGRILENMIKTLQPLGVVTTCGSVSGTQLNVSVFPFILRGITLAGVSAQNYPMPLRKMLWDKLSDEWKPDKLMDIFTEIDPEELPGAIENILKGKMKGRVLVKWVD